MQLTANVIDCLSSQAQKDSKANHIFRTLADVLEPFMLV